MVLSSATPPAYAYPGSTPGSLPVPTVSAFPQAVYASAAPRITLPAPYAQSISMASQSMSPRAPSLQGLSAPIPDIPPPSLAAPNLYLAMNRGLPPSPGSYQTNQNNYYGTPTPYGTPSATGYPGYPTYPASSMGPIAPMGPGIPPGAGMSSGMTPNTMPPGTTPATAAQDQPRNPKETGALSEKLGPTLDDATVKDLNQRLNDPSETVRSEAGMELFKMLQASPDMATHPVYGPYVDAFLQKMVKDPNSLVRQPAYLALETGLAPKPSPQIMQTLQQNAATPSILNTEQNFAQNVLNSLSKNSHLTHEPAGVPEKAPDAGKPPATAPIEPPMPAPGAEIQAIPASTPLPGARLNVISAPGVPAAIPMMPPAGNVAAPPAQLVQPVHYRGVA